MVQCHVCTHIYIYQIIYVCKRGMFITLSNITQKLMILPGMKCTRSVVLSISSCRMPFVQLNFFGAEQ